MRLFYTFVITSLYWQVVAGCAGAQEVPMTPDFSSMEYGRSLLKDQPTDRFVATKDQDMPLAVRENVRNWLEFVLNPAFSPAGNPAARIRYYSARAKGEDDLIEHRWPSRFGQLRLVQGRNVMKLEMPLKAMDDPKRLEQAKEMTAAVVKLKGKDVYDQDYSIELQWPARLGDGARFSSNPTQDINRLHTWARRVDAEVTGDTLSLYFYKKVPQLMAYQDGSTWFKDWPAARRGSTTAPSGPTSVPGL